MTHPPKPTPAVTIAVLTYNYARYLPEALRSVLSQTRTDWELFICDDASTDDTPAVVEPFLSDPRITYVRQPMNRGQAGNWHDAMALGSAPIFGVLHADDAYLPHTLERVLGCFDNDPELDAVYGNWQVNLDGTIDPRPFKDEPPHRLSGRDEFAYQASRHTTLPSVTFLTRAVMARAGAPEPSLRMVVDFEYFLRVAAESRAVAAISDVLCVYRAHAASTTSHSAASGRTVREMGELPALIRSKLGGRHDLGDALRSLDQFMAGNLFSTAVDAAVAGRSTEALELFRQARRMDPSLMKRPKFLIDYGLCVLGRTGTAALRRLHPARVRA